MPRIRSTQKLPSVLLPSGPGPAREAARERERDADAGGRRREVVPRQPRHLRQVAHRRLARVRLPVGVGGEAGGGVEREPARPAPKCCGLKGSTCCSRWMR